MATLPSYNYVIQQVDNRVVLTEMYSEDPPLVSFDPSDANACAIAQGTIHRLYDMTDEDKCFAHFWSGYFYAHATRT